jgi:Tfp pilus assembly protein PilE
MIKGERGSVFLRFLIVVLSVAVILSVLIPQFRQKREEQDRTLCRGQMSALARAQTEFRQVKGAYADNLDSLSVILSLGGDFVCPINGAPYQITAVDSTSYTIGCPNEHGLVRTGSKSWEQK